MEIIGNILAADSETSIGDFHSTLFGRTMDCVIEDRAPIAYAQSCAKFFNSLSNEVVNQLCKSTIRFCNNFLDSIHEPRRTFKVLKDVLSLIRRSVLIVPAPGGDDEPVVHIELECDWEGESGLEWLVRGNEVLYVGAFKGLNPWSSDYNDIDDNCA